MTGASAIKAGEEEIDEGPNPVNPGSMEGFRLLGPREIIAQGDQLIADWTQPNSRYWGPRNWEAADFFAGEEAGIFQTCVVRRKTTQQMEIFGGTP